MLLTQTFWKSVRVESGWGVDSPYCERMNTQVSNHEGEDDVVVERVTAVGASVFGRPVWPRAYHDFVRAVDREVWVRERLVEADFKTIGVAEGSPALAFVRDVVARVENSWQTYSIPEGQRDNALAMLALLHMHVRCVVVPQGGDEADAMEEVGSHPVLSRQGCVLTI